MTFLDHDEYKNLTMRIPVHRAMKEKEVAFISYLEKNFYRVTWSSSHRGHLKSLIWIRENATGLWWVHLRFVVYFEKENDAVLYKLFFHDE